MTCGRALTFPIIAESPYIKTATVAMVFCRMKPIFWSFMNWKNSCNHHKTVRNVRNNTAAGLIITRKGTCFKQFLKIGHKLLHKKSPAKQ